MLWLSLFFAFRAPSSSSQPTGVVPRRAHRTAGLAGPPSVFQSFLSFPLLCPAAPQRQWQWLRLLAGARVCAGRRLSGRGVSLLDQGVVVGAEKRAGAPLSLLGVRAHAPFYLLPQHTHSSLVSLVLRAVEDSQGCLPTQLLVCTCYKCTVCQVPRALANFGCCCDDPVRAGRLG